MAEKLKIKGAKALHGEVSISGAKNAVLKLMAAAILPKGETVYPQRSAAHGRKHNASRNRRPRG